MLKLFQKGVVNLDFNQLASTLDTDIRIKRAQAVSIEIESYIGHGPLEVMEFGCGTGLISLNLKKKISEGLMVDSSSKMIKELEQKLVDQNITNIQTYTGADSSIINWLRHNARTYIFSASNTPAATASALEALHIIQDEPERLEALWEATNYALKRFREAGFEIGATESPIIPLYVRDTEKTFMVTKLAFDEGVFINPVIPPACAPQDTLVRVALMATHTKDQIDRAVEKLVKAFKALDLL